LKSFEEEIFEIENVDEYIVNMISYITLNNIRIEECFIPLIRDQYIDKTISESFDFILKEIRKYDDQTFKDLIQPDPETKKKRNKLLMDENDLKYAKELIEEFCSKNMLLRRKIMGEDMFQVGEKYSLK